MSDGQLELFTPEYVNNQLVHVLEVEDLKPRTKAEWIEVPSNEAVYYFTKTDDDLWLQPDASGDAASLQDYIDHLSSGDNGLYRKVETEMTWQDEVKVLLKESEHCNEGVDIYFHGADKQVSDSQFIKLCHLVASLTNKPE